MNDTYYAPDTDWPADPYPPLTYAERCELIRNRFEAAKARVPVLILLPDMVGRLYPTNKSVQGCDPKQSRGVKIFTIDPPTLFHESMRPAA